MVRRDGAAIRKQRIQEIGRRIMSKLHNHGEIPLSKTIATLQYEIGLTKEKLMEYLGILEAMERFKIEVEGNRIRKVTQEEENVDR